MSVATSAVGVFFFHETPSATCHSPRQFPSVGSLIYCRYSCCANRRCSWLHGLQRTQFSPQRHSQKARRSSDVRLYNSSIVKDVTQTLKASNQQAVAAYDAIAENGSAPKCAEILEAFGWGKLCLTLSYPEDARIPAGVENSQTFAARICIGKEFGHRLFNEWLGKSLEDKTFVPSPAIEKLMAGSSPCRLEWKEASHHAVSSCSAMVHDIDE